MTEEEVKKQLIDLLYSRLTNEDIPVRSVSELNRGYAIYQMDVGEDSPLFIGVFFIDPKEDDATDVWFERPVSLEYNFYTVVSDCEKLLAESGSIIYPSNMKYFVN